MTKNFKIRNIFLFILILSIIGLFWGYNIFYNIRYAKIINDTKVSVSFNKNIIPVGLNVLRKSPNNNITEFIKKENEWVSDQGYIKNILIYIPYEYYSELDNISIKINKKIFHFNKMEVENWNIHKESDIIIIETPVLKTNNKSIVPVFSDIVNWPGDIKLVLFSFPIYFIYLIIVFYILILVFYKFLKNHKKYIENIDNFYLNKIVPNKSKIVYLLLFALFLFQIVLFFNYLKREVLNFYPAYYDQSVYLSISYEWYEELLKSKNLISFFYKKLISDSYGTGFLLYFQSLVTYLFFGATRSSALSVNLFYFILLQIIVFFMTKKITNNYKLAFLNVFFILLLSYSFSGGGLFVFKADFISFCLYGIFVTFVIKSDFFRSNNELFLISITAIVLILFRFFTFLYIGFVYFAFLLIFLFQYLIAIKDKILKKDILQKLIHLSISGFFIFLSTLPFFLINKNQIYNYYFVGQIITNEKYVMSKAVGVTDLISHLLFYPKTIFFLHMGKELLLIFVVIIIAFFIVILVKRNKKINEFKIDKALLLFTMIFCPIFLLIINIAKSPVVSSIVLIPIVWIFFYIFKFILNGFFNDDKMKEKFIFLFTVFIFLLCLVFQISKYNSKRVKIDNIREYNKMVFDVCNYSLEKKIDEPHISFDRISEYFVSENFTNLFYEKNNYFIPFKQNLWAGVLDKSKEDIMNRINTSQFVVFSETMQHSFFPQDNRINLLRDYLSKYLQDNFIYLNNYDFDNYNFKLYGSKEYFDE